MSCLVSVLTSGRGSSRNNFKMSLRKKQKNINKV